MQSWNRQVTIEYSCDSCKAYKTAEGWYYYDDFESGGEFVRERREANAKLLVNCNAYVCEYEQPIFHMFLVFRTNLNYLRDDKRIENEKLAFVNRKERNSFPVSVFWFPRNKVLAFNDSLNDSFWRHLNN